MNINRMNLSELVLARQWLNELLSEVGNRKYNSLIYEQKKLIDKRLWELLISDKVEAPWKEKEKEEKKKKV